jgi:hypothetical protein
MQSGTLVKRETAAWLMAHPVRVQILVIANERPISPSIYLEEVQGITLASDPDEYQNAISAVAYHFRILARAGCLELIDGGQTRGSASEHAYRGTKRAYFSDDEWAELSIEERTEITTVAWQGLTARMEAARMAATVDARDDRWLAWTAAKLDEQGWAEMTEALVESSQRLEAIRGAAEARLAKSNADPISATFALLGFESPPSWFYGRSSP